MSDTITIQGAVLERSDAARPYADSQPISISELELTAPGEGEILVKITAAGICHSDLSVVNNNRPRPCLCCSATSLLASSRKSVPV